MIETCKECPECQEVMHLCEKDIVWFQINEYGGVDREFYCEFYEGLRDVIRHFDNDLTGERKWICGGCNYEEEEEK